MRFAAIELRRPLPWFVVLYAMAVGANLTGLFLPILGSDGTLYASIAKAMVERGDYLNLFATGTDWLDKPHFPFWVAALSFKLFGVHEWSYRLPAVISLLVGALYTWKLAYRLYRDRSIAHWSALILLTAEHTILSSFDVRAEPYLTTLIVASVYHYLKVQSRAGPRDLLLASLFAACAVMTKGPFAVVPIGAAIVGPAIISGRPRELLDAKWLAAGLLVFVGITPELYALYQQFDLHPEKMIFGQTEVSGIRFFFWDSQFGRFLNVGPIRGSGDPSFFLHTTLWAFLPWSLVLYAAVYTTVRDGVRRKEVREWVAISAGLTTFVMFSLSRFQLPHYLNIAFPFFAITTSQFVHSLKNITPLTRVQYAVIGLLMLALAGLHLIFQPNITNVPMGVVIATIVLFTVASRTIRCAPEKERILARSLAAVVVVSCYMNGFFNPRLLSYQGGSTAARFVNAEFAGLPVVQLQSQISHPFEFGVLAPVTTLRTLADTGRVARPFVLVLKSDTDDRAQPPVRSFDLYDVQRFNARFLFPGTREAQLQHLRVYVMR
jgi:4-amino-4-deoxy-L-arabinose transferase-like glycosyltransferase